MIERKKSIINRLERTNKNLKLLVICLTIIALIALSLFAASLKSNNSEENKIQGAAVLETKLSSDDLKK